MTQDNIWLLEVLDCTFSLDQTFFILAAHHLKFMYFKNGAAGHQSFCSNHYGVRTGVD